MASKSIVQKEKRCYLTGSLINLDRHHIFNGPLRDKSEQDGLWVWLNHDMHMHLHQHNPEGLKELKKVGQMALMDCWLQAGIPYDIAQKTWIERYHKNYL